MNNETTNQNTPEPKLSAKSQGMVDTYNSITKPSSLSSESQGMVDKYNSLIGKPVSSNDTNATPLKVTPPPPVSSASTFNNPPTPEPIKEPTLEDAKNNILRDVANLTTETSTGNQRAFISQQESDLGKYDKQTQLDQINADIASAQLATRRKIEDLRKKNPEGMTWGGLEDEINNIQYESDRNVADKMIIQSALTNNVARISEIAKNKAEIEFAPKIAELEAKKIQLNDVYNSLTSEEKRKADELKRKYEIEDRNFRAEQDKATLFEQTKANLALTAYKEGADMSTVTGILSAKSLKDIPSTTTSSENVTKNYPIIDVILGSGKFTKMQKEDMINAIKYGEDPFTVVKNKAKDIMGATEAKSLQNFEKAKGQMLAIQTMLKDFYAKGGSTGLIKGSYEDAVNSLGGVSDPKLVEIATNIASALQIYRNAVSGTAYSVQEGVDIAKIFPGIGKSEGLNEAILKGRMKAFDDIIDTSYSDTLGKEYYKLKEEAKSTETKANDAKQQVIDIGKENVQLQPIIRKLMTENDPKKGRPLTPEEVLQIINQ